MDEAALMAGRRKLDNPTLRKLHEKLRRRNYLLDELAAVSIKRLAAEFGVTGASIRRHEEAIFGSFRGHVRDPDRINSRDAINQRHLEPILAE